MRDLAHEKFLVAKAKKDPEAFGAIYDLYYDEIFGYVFRRVGNVEISKDIISDVFLKAMRNLWKFRWQNISISTWLYKIATNEVNYHYRKKKRKFVSLENMIDDKCIELVSGDNIEAEMIEAENSLQRYQRFLEVREKISALPIKYQEVVSLKLFEQKTIKEICEIVDKKEGTIKSLISRGIAKLRDE